MTEVWDRTNSYVTFSSDRQYRYVLARWWDLEKLFIRFVLLNPSTADETQDDPTIRRCIRYARDWGYGGVIILNIFALRSTDPKVLYTHPTPQGPDNLEHLDIHLGLGDIPAVAGWGTHGAMWGWGEFIHRRYPHLKVLGLTKDGHPKHPLYLPASLTPVDWE